MLSVAAVVMERGRHTLIERSKARYTFTRVRIGGAKAVSRVFFEIRPQKPSRRRRVCGIVADWNKPCVVAEGALPGVRKSSRSLPPGGTVHLPWLLIDPLIGAAVHLDQFFGAEEETDLHLTILR